MCILYRRVLCGAGRGAGGGRGVHLHQPGHQPPHARHDEGLQHPDANHLEHLPGLPQGWSPRTRPCFMLIVHYLHVLALCWSLLTRPYFLLVDHVAHVLTLYWFTTYTSLPYIGWSPFAHHCSILVGHHVHVLAGNGDLTAGRTREPGARPGRGAGVRGRRRLRR